MTDMLATKLVYLDIFENIQLLVIETNQVIDQWAAHRSIGCPRDRIQGESCNGTTKKFYRTTLQVLRCQCCGIVVDDPDLKNCTSRKCRRKVSK